MADRIPLAPADFDHLSRLTRDPQTPLPARTARALSSQGLITWKRSAPTAWIVTESGHTIVSGTCPVYRTYGN